MSVLSVSGLTKYYGAEFIFGGISFQVSRGDKTALVGINGAGKSTLMKIIAGVICFIAVGDCGCRAQY